MARRWLLLLAILALPLAGGAAVHAARNDDMSGVEKASRFLTGQLLIAAPHMPDPRFAQTVIYMISHDAKGAMGLVVNRAFGSGPLRILLETMGVETENADAEVRLHYGGPVEPERGFVLHSADYEGNSTTQLRRGLAVSYGTDVLLAMADGRGPEKSVVVLGYAGWGPGQLENELARDDWLTATGDEALIFSEDLDSVWRRALSLAGLTL